MKIALIHYAAAPVIGGVERVMAEHAAWFRRQGHEVVVLCQRGGESPGVHPLPMEGSAEALWAALTAGLAGVEVAFVHNVMTMPFHLGLTEALARAGREFSEIRWVSWIHDVAASNPDLQPVPDLLRTALPGFFPVTVSPLRQRQWREVSGQEATIIPNGFDPARVLGLGPEVAALAERLGLWEGRWVFLHPTRLLRRKNVEMSLAIVAALTRSGQPATLLVTGAEDPHHAASRNYAQWLREEQARLGAEAFFVGDAFPVGDRELADLYRVADALLLPSRQEGFGLPMLEAAVHRLPIFSSEIEPLAALSGPVGATFSLTDSPEAVAARIREVLAGDPVFRHRKKTLLGYGWAAIGDRYLKPFLENRFRPKN